MLTKLKCHASLSTMTEDRRFQVERENFKINLKIVFCVKHLHLGSSTKRDQLKNLKMHSNDTITNISHQFLCKHCKYNYV